MRLADQKTSFIVSLGLHVTLLLVIIISIEFSPTQYVFENTNQQDVISAVVIGDSTKSKILTQKQAIPPPKPKPAVKDLAAVKPIIPLPEESTAIKLLPKKKESIPKTKQFSAIDLLADIAKQKKTPAPVNKTKLQQDLRAQTEASLQEQLMDESIRVKGEMSRHAQGVVDKYRSLIIQAISEHWTVPTGSSKKKAYSVLLIRLAPGGMVMDVQVTTSSGDPALDSSARAAVFKASPLPVPNDPTEFAAFRQFELKARPETVLTQQL